MFKLFFYIGMLAVLATTVVWGWGGFHTGWSQNKVPIEVVDEITGIETVIYEDRFVAGIDTIAIGYGLALVFLAVAATLRIYKSYKGGK